MLHIILLYVLKRSLYVCRLLFGWVVHGRKRSPDSLGSTTMLHWVPWSSQPIPFIHHTHRALTFFLFVSSFSWFPFKRQSFGLSRRLVCANFTRTARDFFAFPIVFPVFSRLF